MPWVFVFLVSLNILYAVWHRQQIPISVTEIEPLVSKQKEAANIKLVKESAESLVSERRSVEADSLCLNFGPFERKSDAQTLQQRLLSLGVNARIKEFSDPIGVDHWVYLEPSASRDGAFRQVRELQARGIDSYVITVGDLENGVSLGIFSERTSAQGILDRVARLGYSPLIKRLERSRQIYRVQISSGERKRVDSEILGDLSRLVGAQESAQALCEGIDTSR
ncbi:SPOR domain-containing protein [Stutzerimonas urumqiensis]|uniref:SPOR domain-containing protein n=1 Tax=Stutzerimonas urumqiensis TaxID=638269 RepID=UPI000EB0C7A6|nr:SPOR domain-containing protein [Stutzerimonas urumqiensis]